MFYFSTGTFKCVPAHGDFFKKTLLEAYSGPLPTSLEGDIPIK